MPPDIKATWLYKIDHLPYGTHRESLEQWGAAQQWPLRALKQLGARAWLAGSAAEKPDRRMAYNAQPVVITPLPQRQQQERTLIAGPRMPHKPTPPTGGPAGTHDAWGAYIQKHGATGITPGGNAQAQQPSAQAIQAPPSEGATNKRFQEQETRIQQLEQSMNALRTDTTAIREHMNQQLQETDQKMEKLQGDLQDGFRQLTANIQTQMQQQAKASEAKLDNTLADLKRLLGSKPKGKRQEHETEGPKDMET